MGAVNPFDGAQSEPVFSASQDPLPPGCCRLDTDCVGFTLRFVDSENPPAYYPIRINH